MTRDELFEVTQQKTDREIVAATIWAEARGEGIVGMAAVAAVIQNRADGIYKRYGSTYRNVCLKPWQFSCWNIYKDGTKDPNLDLILRGPTGNRWHYAQAITDLVFEKLMGDPTGGATHYHTPDVNPSWASSPQMRFLRQIGNHKFYFEV